jgi:hypothetical protein
MATRKEIEIDQFATYNATFHYRLTTGEPIDLTGCSAKMEIRREYADSQPAISVAVGTGITIEATAGKINVELTPAQTSTLTPGRYFYDVVISKGTQKRRIAEGAAIVMPGVTR